MYKADPLLCCAWVCTGHPKSSSQPLRLQQLPRSKQAMDTGAAPSHTCSSQRHNQPAQIHPAPHFLEPQVPVSAPHTLALQEFPRARQEHGDPHTQHFPMAPNHAQSTHKSEHNIQLGLTWKAAVLRRARPHTPAGSSPPASSSEQLQLLYHLLLCQVPLPS